MAEPVFGADAEVALLLMVSGETERSIGSDGV